jgi:hypothetical protein
VREPEGKEVGELFSSSLFRINSHHQFLISIVNINIALLERLKEDAERVPHGS